MCVHISYYKQKHSKTAALHLRQCTFVCTIVQMHNVAHDLRCNSCVNQTHAHDLSIWSICNMTHLRLIRRYLTFNCSYEKQDFGQVRFHNSCFPAWLKTSCRSLLVTVGTEFTWNRSSFFTLHCITVSHGSLLYYAIVLFVHFNFLTQNAEHFRGKSH